MLKDNIFFADHGLTTTSANHVANMAKEMAHAMEQDLSKIGFVSETIVLLGSDKEAIIKTGFSSDDLKAIRQKLLDIAEAHALMAWLREAIKAKQNLERELEALDLEGFCALRNLDLPKEPGSVEVLNFDDALASLTIKERNEFYQLDATCAVLGKCIHPTSPFSKARLELRQRFRNPCDVDGDGRDSVIHVYKPSVDAEDVDKEFFALQALYRDKQANLNAYKHKIEEMVRRDEQEKAASYAKQVGDYRIMLTDLNAQLKDYKLAELARIAKLKIVIPNSLQAIYDKVNSLGK